MAQAATLASIPSSWPCAATSVCSRSPAPAATHNPKALWRGAYLYSYTFFFRLDISYIIKKSYCSDV